MEKSRLNSDQTMEIELELICADKKHGPMLDPMEGLYTLKCEVMELEREMKRKNKRYDQFRREMRQVAAMGNKLFRDCSSEEAFELLKKE